MSYADKYAESFSIKLKISLEVVAVVFLEEPLRLNPSGARLPSWEGCSRIQPRGQGILLLLFLMTQP